MELMRGSALFRYLLEQYSKKPIGWNFTIAPSSKDSFFDALVAGPEETWQLKIDSIFKPSPLVLGAKVETPDRPATDNTAVAAPYGYRKLDPEFLLKLLEEASDESHPSTKTATKIDQLIGSLTPVSPVESGSYVEGPFVFTKEKIFAQSSSQRQLDEKLSFEIKKLLRDKYPGYG
ncbi:MAG: hypothetical protein ACREBS_09365 [Nitrososphaerales archaeon]